MKILLSLAKQFVFWLFVFAISRAVFFIYYSEIIKIEKIEFSDVFASFWYALPLDISTAAYILIIPFLILFVQSFYSAKWINKITVTYSLLMLFAYILITVSELGIYDEWKTKLQYKALLYLSHPDEIFNSSETKTFFILIGIFILEYSFTSWIYLKFIYIRILKPAHSIIFSGVFLLLTSVILFLGIRGGFGEIPITQSKSYFSKHNFVNLASVNTGYSLLISTIENYKFKNKNPFEFYDKTEARNRVDNLLKVENDTTINILKTKHPNIVLLILESWSADLIQTLGGKEGITPQFRKLEKQGLLFTNLYASGNRSEQGMSAIFSGFPATPITAITHNLDKIIKLPSLINTLKDDGYSTRYYFGGDLMYGGINSYISVVGFDIIKEGHDFSSDLPRGKLGIPDEYLLNEQIKDLGTAKQPFFAALFTLSTHSPYDQPMKDVISWAKTKGQNGYLNSAYYTDRCLGEYFAKAKKQPWYSNTLFILVADHSHNSYKHWSVNSKEYRKIPLLLYGDVLKDEYKGSTVDIIGSQTDIGTTLMSQLGIDNPDFYWSRNLFNPTINNFAFYEATDGVGWITPGGYFVYKKTIDDYPFVQIKEEDKDSIIKDGQSYLQELFRQFMEY